MVVPARGIPHRFRHLNTWFPANNTVWEGAAVSLEEVYHPPRASFECMALPHLSSPCFLSVDKNVIPQLPAPVALAWPALRMPLWE